MRRDCRPKGRRSAVPPDQIAKTDRRSLHLAVRLAAVAGLGDARRRLPDVSGRRRDIKEFGVPAFRQPDHRRHGLARTTGWPSSPGRSIRASSPPMAANIPIPKLERMVAKVVGNLTTVSGNPEPGLPHHHPQLAQRQRLRAARRLSLRDARASGAGQRFGRARRRHRPRDGPRDRQSRPAAPAEGSRGGAGHQGRRPTFSAKARPPRWR